MPGVLLVKVGHRTARQKFGQPLGLMYLASYLRQNFPELKVKIIDLLPEGLSFEQVLEQIGEFQPELLGISGMSFEAKELHHLAQLSKKNYPKIPIVVGGPYPTTAGEICFQDKNLDFLVRGEGEFTLAELVDWLIYGRGELKEILGLAYRENGRAQFNPPRPFIEDLDSLPFPAWDLIKIERYFDLPRFGTTYVHKEYMQVMTSRGCTFKCTYCHRIFGVGFRPRSPENVVAEMEILQKQYGIKELYIIDDCFNNHPRRAKRICELILERGLKFSINFPNGIRGDMVDDELLEKLKAIGTYRITYAVETASPRLQKMVKKHLNLEKVKTAIEKTDQKDIMVDGFFMIGFPSETKEEIKKTLDFALKSKLHSFNIWFVTPFPGTELFQQATEMGYQLKADFEQYTYFFPETTLSELNPRQLKRLARWTFIRFYLNPWRLWRIIKLFPNKKQLPYLLWLAIKYSFKWT